MRTFVRFVAAAAIAALCAVVAGRFSSAQSMGSTSPSPVSSAPSAAIPLPRMIPNDRPLRPDGEPRTPRITVEAATAAPAIISGTWTPIVGVPLLLQPNSAFLLTDGRVLIQDGNLTNIAWWTLTPDNTGSYVNGSWTQVASPPSCFNGFVSQVRPYSPLYYASAVLPDGRFVMIGGEYNYSDNYLGKNFEVWSDQGAIYDPVKNSWTCIKAPSSWTKIGDAQSVVLNDGTFLLANPFNNQVATINFGANPPVFNTPFTPSGKSADRFNDEEGWTLLPNGTVLTAEIWNANDATNTPTLAYDPAHPSWSTAGIAPDPLVLLQKGSVQYFEVGPAILRPDGTVFFSGGTGFNDIYDTSSHTWSSGPSFPTINDVYSGCSSTLFGAIEQLVPADAPAALLPDGNVLIAASPIDASCEWIPPVEFFEFDGVSLSQVNSPTFAPDDVSFQGRLLVLPTGQILWTDYNDAEIYTPTGTPNSLWEPTITDAPSTVSQGGTGYQLTGTQFNGLSQAVGYGDDYQAATNYPLVRIINNATDHVFYTRTHDHSTMAIATGNNSVTTKFDVPAAIETGASTLVVVANGIASQPVSLTVTSATATPTATATATPTATATHTPTATATPTATPTAGASLGISPNPLNFGNLRIGRVKKGKPIILSNTAVKGGPSITFQNPLATLPNGGDFFFTGTNCHAILPAGAHCKILLGFQPSTTGLLSEQGTIFDNAKGNPQHFTVQGNGTSGLPRARPARPYSLSPKGEK